MADLILYGDRTGNSMRAAAALYEAGLEFEVRRVNLVAREHQQPAFADINPAMQVPVLSIRDGDSVRYLSQSNAIILFAADHAPGQILPIDRVGRTCALERFFFVVTDLLAPGYAAFMLGHYREREASRLMLEVTLGRLYLLEAYLSKSSFLAGDTFSIADIAAYGYIVSIQEHADLPKMPHLYDWLARMSARTGLQKGLRAFG